MENTYQLTIISLWIYIYVYPIKPITAEVASTKGFKCSDVEKMQTFFGHLWDDLFNTNIQIDFSGTIHSRVSVLELLVLSSEEDI